MATRKPFAAFGRILYANYYDTVGEVIDFTTSVDSKTALFFTKGNLTIRDKQTGQVVEQVGPEWYRDHGYDDGLYNCTVNESSISWCYDPLVNKGYVPVIEPFILKQGQTTELVVHAQLFLCQGTLQVNGTAYNGPYQLAIRTGNATVVATTDVYGLTFK